MESVFSDGREILAYNMIFFSYLPMVYATFSTLTSVDMIQNATRHLLSRDLGYSFVRIFIQLHYTNEAEKRILTAFLTARKKSDP